jgi:RNA polymerase-binding transcription factor DksA
MENVEVEERLLAERAAAAQHLESMSADLAAVAAAAGGSNLDDEHDPEGSTIAFEREQLAALRARVHVRLIDLDAALDRLRHGRYGRCVSCGRAVGEVRLEALPATRLCVGCAGARRR